MDSLKIGDFLFKRVQESILQSQYIETVTLDFGIESNFGNEYIRLSYTVKPNELFHGLPVSEQSKLFNGSRDCIFSISTYSTMGRGNFRKELLRILEFKHIYESIASYITLQLELALNPEASIKIQGIDLWPEANYAEKYLSSPSYFKQTNHPSKAFRDDVSQWSQLHKLAQNTKKIATEQKDYLRITDVEISKRFGIPVNDIRSLLLRYEVPIKIAAIKIIEEIHIHTMELLNALKKDIQTEYYGDTRYRHYLLINYLYNVYLDIEKAALIDGQKSKFLKQFIIQEGDILQLKDDRIVVADSIEIGMRNEIIVAYAMLKVNLEVGARQRKISCENVAYVLKKEDFFEYKDYTSLNRISLLKKWMTRRKKRVDYVPFEPNLMIE